MNINKEPKEPVANEREIPKIVYTVAKKDDKNGNNEK